MPKKHRVWSMKLSFIFFLLLAFSASSSFASPGDRCRVEHCLCKVRGDVGKNQIPETKTFQDIVTVSNSRPDLKNSCIDRRLSVYFEYDRSNLNSNDRVDITKFVQTNSFAGGFYLEGFASSSGNRAYNQRLSQLRVESVANQIRKSIRRPMRMRAESFGERYASSQDSGSDRKVKITPLNNFVELLDLKKTDYYLIDQSGSMQKYWDDIQEYKFHSRHVQIYLSTVNYCENGIHLRQMGSYGGTHIWYSFWYLIDQMRPGSSVTIVSDFQTPLPLTEREWGRLRAKLASKNISLKNVHFVQIEGANLFRQITR